MARGHSLEDVGVLAQNEAGEGGLGLSSPLGTRVLAVRAAQLPPQAPPHPDMNPYLAPGFGDSAGNELKDKPLCSFHACSQTLQMQSAGREDRTGRALGSCSPRPQARADWHQRVSPIGHTPGA